MVDNGTSWNGFTVVVSAYETAGKAPGALRTYERVCAHTTPRATEPRCYLSLLAATRTTLRFTKETDTHPQHRPSAAEFDIFNPGRRASKTKHLPLLRIAPPDCSITTPKSCHQTANLHTMAPKRNAAAPPPSSIPPSVATPAHGQTSASSQSIKSSKASAKSTPRNSQDAQDVLLGVWDRYVQQTPQRVKLIDVFMAFLIVVGVLQFVYCVIAGNYVCCSLCPRIRSRSVSCRKSQELISILTAIQRFPIRFLCYGRSIRPHCQLEDSDKP